MDGIGNYMDVLKKLYPESKIEVTLPGNSRLLTMKKFFPYFMGYGMWIVVVLLIALKIVSWTFKIIMLQYYKLKKMREEQLRRDSFYDV